MEQSYSDDEYDTQWQSGCGAIGFPTGSGAGGSAYAEEGEIAITYFGVDHNMNEENPAEEADQRYLDEDIGKDRAMTYLASSGAEPQYEAVPA